MLSDSFRVMVACTDEVMTSSFRALINGYLTQDWREIYLVVLLHCNGGQLMVQYYLSSWGREGKGSRNSWGMMRG